VKIIDPNDCFVLDRGDKLAPITLKLQESNAAINRLHEIKNANVATFPELLTAFISANNELSQAIATVRQELVKIEHKTGLLRAKLLIEEVPIIIQERQLKNTQDICNSIMMLNPEYSNLVYSCEVLKSALDILEAKMKTIRDGQFAVRDVVQLNLDKPHSKKMSFSSNEWQEKKYVGEF